MQLFKREYRQQRFYSDDSSLIGDMHFEIAEERPDSTDSKVLINELDDLLEVMYPSESRYGLSPEQLLKENVAFFVARLDGDPVGCCGIKFYGHDYGEVKRMYVRPAMRRRGLGSAMLDHLERCSLQRGVKVIRLETGTRQPEAIIMYEIRGYRQVPPFGHYTDDPLSLYYEKRLESEQ